MHLFHLGGGVEGGGEGGLEQLKAIYKLNFQFST